MIHYQWHWFRRWRERCAERAWYAENRRILAEYERKQRVVNVYRLNAQNYTQIMRDVLSEQIRAEQSATS